MIFPRIFNHGSAVGNAAPLRSAISRSSKEPNPIRRLRRTGLAATMRVYGARGSAEAMIARVRRMHDGVAGTTSIGRSHRANSPKTAIQFLEHRREIYGYASRAHVNDSTNCNRIHSRCGR
jgi:hypothetical protein